MRLCHFQAQNDPVILTFFFSSNHYYYFHLPTGPFHCAKFKQKFWLQIQSYEDAPFFHFWSQNGPFAFLPSPPIPPPPPKKKMEKIINIIFIYLLSAFTVQNLKIILTAGPELWEGAIFRPKIAHLPKLVFFQRTC